MHRMFFGEYEHTIDDKNRLTLPARFRDALAGGVVLTRGLDECLDVYRAPRLGRARRGAARAARPLFARRRGS